MTDIPPQYLPSDYQRKLWWKYVDEGSGVDDNGNWLGQCPLHKRDPDAPTAWFNFRAGVLKCLGDPSCHEGHRAMSLNNVMIRLAAEGKQGEGR